jgi:hypothetical protein
MTGKIAKRVKISNFKPTAKFELSFNQRREEAADWFEKPPENLLNVELLQVPVVGGVLCQSCSAHAHNVCGGGAAYQASRGGRAGAAG